VNQFTSLVQDRGGLGGGVDVEGATTGTEREIGHRRLVASPVVGRLGLVF
jgi:hypothetical protein